MRKTIPIILSICIIFVVIILVIVSIKKDVIFFSIKTNYNICSTTVEDDYININIYINDNNSYITDKKQVINSYITDTNKDSVIELSLINIYKSNNYLNYEKQEYNLYVFEFEILFNTQTYLEWYINDALLEMNYNEDKQYQIKIGNFSFIKIEESKQDIISISTIKPLTTIINDNTHLAGIILGIRNLDSKLLIINEVKILNAGITIGNNITQLTNLPDGNDFNSIAGYNYSSLNKGYGKTDILLDEEVKYILIPLFYEDLIVAKKFPISIKIGGENIEVEYFLSNYTYYEPVEQIIKKASIYKYNIL